MAVALVVEGYNTTTGTNISISKGSSSSKGHIQTIRASAEGTTDKSSTKTSEDCPGDSGLGLC